jgi:hypothetical protein
MPERIDARPVLTVAGAALLLISLFQDWYTVPGLPPAPDATFNAWATFESLDLVLAGVAILAIYVSYEQITGRDRLGRGWLLPLSTLGLVVVASQILDPPPSMGSIVDLSTGAWLGLGGAAAMVAGAVLSAARVSLALELDSTGTTRRRAAQDA